jgi:hypothetical protein
MSLAKKYPPLFTTKLSGVRMVPSVVVKVSGPGSGELAPLPQPEHEIE